MSGRADQDRATDTDELSASVLGAQAGDEESFCRLYRAVQPLLLRYLRVLVGAAADDVASETWLQIVRDLYSFRGDYDSFRGWAATIARHRALDHVRYQRRRPSVAVPVEELRELADAADTAGLTEEALATRAAIELIATLPPDQAEVVLLRVVLNLDVATTARVLGKRAGAVRTAAHRGLRRLAEQLRQRATVTTVTADTIGPDRGDATAAERDGATVTAAGRLTLKDMR